MIDLTVHVAAWQYNTTMQVIERSPSPPLQSTKVCEQHGFTLIELVMVILVLGILSVYAAPRMFNSDDFYARGFHDETLAILRYAQKAAIAQRRPVCVALTQGAPSIAILTIASVSDATTCNVALNWPNKNCNVTSIGATACIESRSGISYNASQLFSFNGLGQPIGLHSTLVMTVTTGTANFNETVELETGYVHE